ncbi:MAG TPA: methanogenesis marker 16 metalloprotein [Candidatus Bathyarchaeia archaeon]|nr:methanogenesis marker 16 metalloprotein [Candidatus Bathyarchaeia archaeon]
MRKRRTIAEITERVESGEAVVMTAEELCNSVRSGEDVGFEDVDVVTSATCGVMSGTFAVFSFQVAERDEFERASKVSLNGVPAFVGPCPNERLGIVDVIVYGPSHRDNHYGGGHLFRALVAHDEIEVAVETVDGREIETTTTLDKIPLARLCSTRNAFKNYYAFVNAHENEVTSIFSVSKFKGPFKELTFSGCGELNPLEKDPFMDTIGVGTKILMNGAEGFVIGEGTRSSAEKPNLMGIADMHGMLPEYLGGFQTSAGPEIWTSWAVPIPILNEHVLENAKKLDEEIKLGVLDVHNRLPVGEITYADVWRDFSVRFDRSSCIECEECQVASLCPTDAFDAQTKEIDEELCYNCGACVHLCEGVAFSSNLGVVTLAGREIPVTLRQSDRKRASQLAAMLKRKILDGDFTISEPVARFNV